MPAWVRSPATRAAARVPAPLTLTALGALAFWAWYNDGRLSPARPGGRRNAKPTAGAPALGMVDFDPGRYAPC